MTPPRNRAPRTPVTALAAACRRLRDALVDTGHTAPRPGVGTADDLAPTVALALLLTRLSGTTVTTGTLHDIGAKLTASDPLLSRALHHLATPPPTPTPAPTRKTEPAPAPKPGSTPVAEVGAGCLPAGLRAALDQLVGAVNAVDPDAIARAHAGAAAGPLLCEQFLAAYDSTRRRASGSYYTPPEVAGELVRLVDEVVRLRVGSPAGLAGPGLTLIDPAMGAGTFLHAASDLITDRRREHPETTPTGPRLVGIEHQLAPYTAARLLHTTAPNSGTRLAPVPELYRADTLHTELTLTSPHPDPDPNPSLTSGAGTGADVNRPSPGSVVVVLGNPPIREGTTNPADLPAPALAWPGYAPWDPIPPRRGNVRSGIARVRPGAGSSVPGLDAFRTPGNGPAEHVLHNLTVHFTRWATRTAFETHPAGHGIIALITTAALLRGVGYRGLRAYLRRTCDEGWIIDLSPEGLRPGTGTRLFPTVQQPLAIAIFWRRPTPATDPTSATRRPASIHHTALTGTRQQKQGQLHALTLHSPRWRPVRPDWTAPFTPAATTRWDDFPALADLMPWAVPGIQPNRTWVYAPCPSVLHQRWHQLTTTPPPQRRLLLKDSTDRTVDTIVAALPGFPPPTATLAEESGPCPPPVPVTYRSFDRQWLIPDNRLLHRPSPRLWHTAHTGTTFLLTHHTRPLTSGPGIVLSALPPDTACFKGFEAGPVIPTHHPTGAPNTAPGLLALLARRLTPTAADPAPVTVEDLVAYLAAVLAHRGYTARFATDLTSPGIRVPLTTDPQLWTHAVHLGRQVAWLHTYGDRYTDTPAGRPPGTIAYPDGDPRRPRCTTPVPPEGGLPDRIDYNPGTQTLHVGAGVFHPVPAAVWAYDVGGMPIVRTWLSRRQHRPRRTHRPGTPLDRHHRTGWSPAWTTDLEDLLTLLRRLVDLEPAQATLLDQITTGPLLNVGDLTAAGVLPTTRCVAAIRRT